MSKDLERYLLEAEGKSKGQVPLDNSYRDIGFDGDKGRLGWVRALPFLSLKKSLAEIAPVFEGKDNFIFIGMGGSINGIKPLISVFKAAAFFTLDNLDPRAAESVISKIKDLRKTLVVAISKSGTTKETQLLATTLKELFSQAVGPEGWKEHFLWLSDPTSFAKLDSSGWGGVKKVSIQFDQETDIGGRFSSPHTLIFFLPLFLLVNRDFRQLENIYNDFLSSQAEIRNRAYREAFSAKDKAAAYFSPLIDERLTALSSWIVQLFQESLGSKLKNFSVKTVTNSKEGGLFTPLRLSLEIDSPTVSLMAQMYFFQIFIAYFSAFKGINFVTQEYVEKYKSQMRKLEEGSGPGAVGQLNLDGVIGAVEKNLKRNHRFIEIVLYFYPDPEAVTIIEDSFKARFPDKTILVFVGSDWNHQSYQAAFGDADSFYVLLLASLYQQKIASVSSDTLAGNLNTLKIIAEATYLTLKDKSILACYKV